MLKFWRYPYQDLHRALLVLLPISINILIFWLLQFNIATILCLNLSSLFSGLALTGSNKKQQSMHHLIFAIIAMSFVSIVLFLKSMLIIWLFQLSLIPIFFSLLSLASIKAKLSKSCLFASMLIVLILGFSIYLPFSPYMLVISVLLPMTTGFLTTFFVILLLPTSSILAISAAKISMLRAARIALAVSLCFLICDYFNLMRPAWAAMSVLAISQGTLGGTVKKAYQRLIGTMLGVTAAAPLGIYLFDAHTELRYFVLIAAFYAALTVNRFYTIAIFLGTLCFAAIFFILFPESHDIIPFVADRLLETALGIAVIVTLETLIYPCSVIAVLRQHTQGYWRQLSLTMDAADQQDFSDHTQQAKQKLMALCRDFSEFRYEPLNLLNHRYYYARQTVNSLLQFQTLLSNYHKQNEFSPSLQQQLNQYYQKIACQYNLTHDERVIFLEKLLPSLQINPDEQHAELINKLCDVIQCTLKLLKAPAIDLLPIPK